MSKEQQIHDMIGDAFAAGMVTSQMLAGTTSGEISQRQARKNFGKWFTDADREGRIQPVSIDGGNNGTRHYRVVDILQLRLADRVKAIELKL